MFTVAATVLQTPTPDAIEHLDDVRIVVGDDGRIVEISNEPGPVDVRLGDGAVLLPGLIDTHIHAPQWPQLGTGLDLPLDRWLFEYTFPLEHRATDPAFAGPVWQDLVEVLLAHGTTTAVYFATIDVDTTTMLAATCATLGQRAFVGRVAMDHPEGTPEWYRDVDAVAGVDASAQSIEQIAAIGSDLVEPIITPRFTPACTDELLNGLGDLAEATGLRVQTHCSESDWQHQHAHDRYGRSDTEALDAFGLLRPHTVLAHGDHLSETDLGSIATVRAGVAHCPLSNAYFANAVFPARRASRMGAAVGLGSDIAGGSSPGLLAQCAHAVTASRYLEDGVDAGIGSHARGVAESRLSIVEAFHMATVGGARLLGLDVGVLAPGRPFDAFAIDLDRPGSALRRWGEIDDDARVFEKVIRLAGADDITDVWVGGRRVAGSRSST
ncbi:MAG: amidohydrolase family protein [Actinomycetota bacterium]